MAVITRHFYRAPLCGHRFIRQNYFPLFCWSMKLRKMDRQWPHIPLSIHLPGWRSYVTIIIQALQNIMRLSRSQPFWLRFSQTPLHCPALILPHFVHFLPFPLLSISLCVSACLSSCICLSLHLRIILLLFSSSKHTTLHCFHQQNMIPPPSYKNVSQQHKLF